MLMSNYIFNAMSEDNPPSAVDIENSWWPFLISSFVSLVWTLRKYMIGKDFKGTQTADNITAVITGGNSGIGYETAKDLARRGALVIMACRNIKAGENAAAKIRKSYPNAKLEVRYIDLSVPSTITEFVRELEHKKIHLLINNAGVAFQPYETTPDGLETHFVTNYFGHFMLTQSLLPKMQDIPESRVISLASKASLTASLDFDNINLKGKYTPARAFAQSKLCLVLMTRHMSECLQQTNVNFLCVDPGIVRGTKQLQGSILYKSRVLRLAMTPIMWLLMKPPKGGAQSVLYAALDPSLNKHRGAYISDCEVTKIFGIATSDELASELYDVSLELVESLVGTKSST